MANANARIFIVDDETHSTEELRVFLTANGFAVDVASDGEQAVRYLEEQSPDLILLDIILPKLDGFTVAKKIRYQEHTRNVPIIVFSAKEGMKDLFAIEGIHDYMVKPVDHQQLLALIRKRLGIEPS